MKAFRHQQTWSGCLLQPRHERLNPHIWRVAALPAPNERERTQWYPLGGILEIEDAALTFNRACAPSWEAIVSKRRGSPYKVAARDWLKTKNPKAQRAVPRLERVTT